MYYNGSGAGDNAVAQDFAKAFPWLEAAADAGNAMAQTLLCSMYYEGRGVERDLAAAAGLALKAADQGIASARYSAALMLAKGEGVEPDPVSAYAWFAVLAEAGYPGAARNRDVVAAGLTEDRLSEAQDRARAMPRQR